jgi:hypothetical protein
VHHHRHSHVVEHPSLQQRHPPGSSAGVPINLIVTYRIPATSCSATAAPADAAAMMSCPASNPRDTIRHLGGTAMFIEGEVGSVWMVQDSCANPSARAARRRQARLPVYSANDCS